jgi:hypothetical protein
VSIVELLTELQPSQRLATVQELELTLKPGCRRSSARMPLTVVHATVSGARARLFTRTQSCIPK